ncbi:hypothetical protein ABH941_007344 [Streptacidiphilus sp. EB103A]
MVGKFRDHDQGRFAAAQVGGERGIRHSRHPFLPIAESLAFTNEQQYPRSASGGVS